MRISEKDIEKLSTHLKILKGTHEIFIELIDKHWYLTNKEQVIVFPQIIKSEGIGAESYSTNLNDIKEKKSIVYTVNELYDIFDDNRISIIEIDGTKIKLYPEIYFIENDFNIERDYLIFNVSKIIDIINLYDTDEKCSIYYSVGEYSQMILNMRGVFHYLMPCRANSNISEKFKKYLEVKCKDQI